MQLRLYFRLAIEDVRMLHYATVRYQTVFYRPELIDRIATMLNYWLVRLAGKDAAELRVRANVGFTPKRLLVRTNGQLLTTTLTTT